MMTTAAKFVTWAGLAMVAVLTGAFFNDYTINASYTWAITILVFVQAIVEDL